MANDLRRCANSGACPELGGITLQYAAGRGDWQHMRAWLAEDRDYQNLRGDDAATDSLCKRCACASNLVYVHWADVLHHSWNAPASAMATLDKNVAPDLPCPGIHMTDACWGFRLCVCSLLHSRFLIYVAKAQTGSWMVGRYGGSRCHALLMAR